jgi:hypothetical protein
MTNLGPNPHPFEVDDVGATAPNLREQWKRPRDTQVDMECGNSIMIELPKRIIANDVARTCAPPRTRVIDLINIYTSNNCCNNDSDS